MKFTEFIKGKTKKIFEEYRGDDDDDERPDDWRDEPQVKKPSKKDKEKPEKEVKKFNVGDVLILVDNKKSNKLPADAYDFLITFKTFTVIKVSESGKLDLGCHVSKNEPTGGVEKIYMFSPNRFELKDATLKKEEIKPLEEVSPEDQLRKDLLGYDLGDDLLDDVTGIDDF